MRFRIARASCFALTLVLSATAFLIAEDEPKTPNSRIQAKSYDFKEAGKEMRYALFVPSSYDKAKKSPLMVALHGLGSNPHQIIRYPGLVPQAEKHGYIVVAPMGYNSHGWYGSRGATSRRSKPENLGELSEKDVMNVLAIVRKEYSIDDKRIYLMGHSMGGGGTWHIGTKYPKIWAGLAPIAPAIASSTRVLEKIQKIPVIVVQGAKDKLVPVTGARKWVAKMKELKMDYEYIEDEDGGHVRVAFKYLPRIFEFFEERAKKKAKPEKKTPPPPTTPKKPTPKKPVERAS